MINRTSKLQKVHHDAPSMTGSTRNETPTCQLYNGSVCRKELLSMTGHDYLTVVTDEYQGVAQLILSLIDRLDPCSECASNPQIRPFVCLYFFGLCDKDTGVSYRPCASQCKNIRDNICRDEWRRLASFICLPSTM